MTTKICCQACRKRAAPIRLCVITERRHVVKGQKREFLIRQFFVSTAVKNDSSGAVWKYFQHEMKAF